MKTPMGRIYNAGMEDKAAMEKAADKLSKQQHTPTPWTTYGWKDSDEFGIQMSTTDGKHGAVLPHGNHRMKLEDADFLIRAVNSHEAMYKALGDALCYAQLLGSGEKTLLSNAELIEIITNALNIAEGK